MQHAVLTIICSDVKSAMNYERMVKMEYIKSKLRSVASAIILFLGLQTSAFAFVDPPILVPSVADVGQSIGVQFTAGICDIFVEHPQGAYPQITVSGNQIHLVMFSFHEEDPIECVFPLVETFIQPLGTFDAGRYVVVIDRVYPRFGGALATERLAELQLVVGGVGTPAAQLPVNAPLALLAAILALIWIVRARFRRSSMDV